MKTILVTAYAVNPFKGSEDGTGWNWILQIAKYQKVIAITRKNNQPHIEKFMKLNKDDRYQNIDFRYYDLYKWVSFWKKGNRGALVYFYLWQMTIPLWIHRQAFKFDIAHNLNFHNNWLPTFLWILGKPTVWGPIGHHEVIPKPFLLPIYGIKEYLLDRTKGFGKILMRTIDPFFYLAKYHCKVIIVINSASKTAMGQLKKIVLTSAIGSSTPESLQPSTSNTFNVLSVGRFVSLKGFDITIKSFAAFYNSLSSERKDEVCLILVGKGPFLKHLQDLTQKLGISNHVKWINWVEQSEMARLYQQSSIFLFPSHEGAGMVVPEALSYSLPVICLDNAGPGELIDESCGIKIKISNYQKTISDVSNAILDIYNNPNKRNQMSIMANTRFRKLYDWDRKGEFIREVYQKL